MWMPLSCTWNDLSAASTPYDSVLAGQAGRMPVSMALWPHGRGSRAA
jgi:hypothetical protein